jgi:hypothetical protein
MPDRVSGFVLGVVTIGAAMFFFSGLVQGAAHTWADRPILGQWGIAADQLLHGTG